MLTRNRILNPNSGGVLRRRAVKFLSASLSVCGMLWHAGTAQAAPTAADLLKQMATAETKLAYSAKQVTTRNNKREVARVWRNGRKQRIEWLEPAIKRGDILVDNGTTASLYLRSENAVVETNSSTFRMPPRGGATVLGQEKVNGRTAWKVKSGPRTVWIDAATKARLRVQSTWGSLALENVQFAPVSASKFRLDAPAGASRQKLNGTLYPSLTSARRAAAWLKAPEQLPVGYSLENAIVSSDTVWLRYVDGAGRFSLFIQKGEQGTVAPTEMKEEGGWFWKRDGLRYFVTGAPADAVQKLYSSLK